MLRIGEKTNCPLGSWDITYNFYIQMDESETLKNYLSQIPEQFHKNLDELIDEEIICMVADSLKEDWSARYDLLKLTFNELRDIQEENTLAQSQR